MRRRHDEPSAARASRQVDTPRLVKSPYPASISTLASNRQRAFPVAGSIAKTRPSGVETYIVPSTTIGVTSSDGAWLRSTLVPSSPVLKVHATCSLATLERSICKSGEKRDPPASPPYA